MNRLLYCTQYTFINASTGHFDALFSHVTLLEYSDVLVVSNLMFFVSLCVLHTIIIW